MLLTLIMERCFLNFNVIFKASFSQLHNFQYIHVMPSFHSSYNLVVCWEPQKMQIACKFIVIFTFW